MEFSRFQLFHHNFHEGTTYLHDQVDMMGSFLQKKKLDKSSAHLISTRMVCLFTTTFSDLLSEIVCIKDNCYNLKDERCREIFIAITTWFVHPSRDLHSQLHLLSFVFYQFLFLPQSLNLNRGVFVFFTTSSTSEPIIAEQAGCKGGVAKFFI